MVSAAVFVLRARDTLFARRLGHWLGGCCQGGRSQVMRHSARHQRSQRESLPGEAQHLDRPSWGWERMRLSSVEQGRR